MIEPARVHAQELEVQRRQFDQKVERARYEINLARREYNVVNPKNRWWRGIWKNGLKRL
jgi:hypothetical protein